MNKLHFTIDINAQKEKVWEIMLADETYQEWTSAFQEGSYFEGSWEKGSNIRFLAADKDGKLSGMAGKIVENKPYEYISIEQLGEVVDGELNTTSDNVQQWIGGHENYTFSEKNGVTTLTVEMESDNVSQEMTEMFKGMWPRALAKLKHIVER